jgi:hypothetical protein
MVGGSEDNRVTAAAPLSINLDLTVACNYRCGHCIDADVLNTGRRFDFPLVIDSLVALRLGGLRTVILIGGGEPTLYPQFTPAVRVLKLLGLGVGIVSNGSMNGKLLGIVPLLREGDWVRLSLDAATDETFRQLHRPIRHVTLREICASAARIKVAAPKIQLGFSFIVMWQADGPAGTCSNVHEIATAAQLARDWGFDYIAYKPQLMRDAESTETIAATSNSSLDAIPLRAIASQLVEARRAVGTSFRVYESINLLALFDTLRFTRARQQPSRCHMQRFRQVLTPDGLFGCPAYRGDERNRIGNVDAFASITALLDTERDTLKQIEHFDAARTCRNITCIYNDVNWLLESAVTDHTELDPLEGAPNLDLFL